MFAAPAGKRRDSVEQRLSELLQAAGLLTNQRAAHQSAPPSARRVVSAPQVWISAEPAPRPIPE